MNTITVENHTLRVTLPSDEFEKIGRYGVFNDAMRMLGNRSEAAILKNEPVDDDEVFLLARSSLVTEWIVENGRYNTNETLMRMDGGYRMSIGMQRDVDRARAYADKIMNTDGDPQAIDALINARAILERERAIELKYRNAISTWCHGWNIEIIGEMPEQIGMCRYREVS